MATDTAIASKFGLHGATAYTRLSHVDGQAGELVIRGFAAEELATKATYEEAAYLLWTDRLPDAAALDAFKHDLVRERRLPGATMALLRAAAQQAIEPMDALRMAVGTLTLRNEDEVAAATVAQRDGLAVVARFPVIVAAYWRMLRGLEPITPRADFDHATNYLYMLTGEAPSASRVRALETYLVALIDHALNASTFAARTIISTQSDLISAVTGAVGALKGALHGGAPGPALQTVLDISAQPNADAERFLRDKLARGERLMGFGHRVYKNFDPRTYVLSTAARQVYEAEGQIDVYQLAIEIEHIAVRLLAEYKPGRDLYANVEYYAGLLLHGVGLPAALFTPTFAIARSAGWVAHCLEQQQANRLMQPQSVYTGSLHRTWVPLQDRLSSLLPLE